MPVARSRRASRAAALVAAFAAFVVLLGLGVSQASAEGPGASISGHVTDPLGNPVAGVIVNASGGFDFPTTTTDADGGYTLAGLTTGAEYRLVFVAPAESDLVNQYYSGATSYQDATPVVLATDEVRTGIDAVLEQGGAVSGTVTKADGSPGAGATIFVIPPGLNTDVAVGRALDDGTYVVHGVPAGSYQLKFEGSDLESVPALWYPGSPSRDEAAIINVAAATVTSGIDVVRPPESVPDPTGGIAGLVRSTTGNLGAGVTVTATGPAGSFSATTGPSGTYSLQVPVGTYVVGASHGGLTGFHPAAATSETATPVTVTAGGFLFGTDITIQPAAPPVQVPRISGRITGPDGAPIAGAIVQAAPRAPLSGAWATAWTDADGNYTINDLTPGSYDVQAQGPFGSSFVPRYYPDAKSSWEGTPLTIDADSHLTGIDISLPVGGSITGTVTVPAGVSLSAVSIYASDDQAGSHGYASVDPTTGTYTITGLLAGSYRLQVSAWGTNLVTGYYPGVTTYSGATLVPAVAGATTSGIDFDLVAGGTVSGVVSGPDGPLPGANVQVSVPGDFGSGGYATTDETGHYTVVGLRGGSYTVQFLAPWGSGLVSSYYPGVFAQADATLVTVPAGGSATVDGQLERSAAVSGRVTDTDGNPVTQAFVTLYDESGAQFGFAGGEVDADGRYSITADVPSGTFTVQVSPYNDSPFPPAYYPGVPTLSEATFLTLASGESKTGVDITLSRGAELQLTLSAPGNAPAQGVFVELVDESGVRDDGAVGRTDDSGALDLRGLNAGSKRIAIARASADTPYVAQYFAAPHGTQVKESKGTLVALEAGETTTLSATLRTGAQITGVLRDANGTPQVGQMVVAFVEDTEKSSSLVTRSAITGPDGTYVIRGLLEGRYLVAAPYTSANFGDTFYGTGTSHGKPNVKVVGTKTTKNIDITIGTTFTDVQPTAPFAADIEWIAGQGILPGVTAPDGTSTFGSTGTVTRGDLAGALFRAAGSPAQKAAKKSPFTDVPSSSPQYAAIVWASSKGYLAGSTDHGKKVFRPGAVVVRAQAAGALYRFAGAPFVARSKPASFADVGWCTPEYRAITWLGTLGVTSGGTNAVGSSVFRPKAGLERGALAEALHKAVAGKH